MQEVTPEEALALNNPNAVEAPTKVLDKPKKKVKKEKKGGLCSVSNPKQVGEGVSAYVTYAVQSLDSSNPGKSITAVRRFSDFEWLHARLSEEFPDVLIPPVPEKQIINRLASGFVEYRRKELERFLTRVLTHPRLSQSQFVKPFLTATEPVMAEQRGVKYEKPKTGTDDDGGQVGAFFGWAAAKFSTATGQMEPTKEVDPSFDEFKDYVHGLNAQLTSLQALVETNIAKKRELDKTLIEFSQASGALATAEKPHDPLLSDFWSKLSVSLKKMAALNEELANAETNKFDDVLKDYIRLTASGKILLENRFELLGKLQIAQTKNANNVAALQTELQSMTKSASGELTAFKEQKTKDLRESLRAIVRINMKHQQEVVALWKALLSDLEEHSTTNP